MSKIDEHPHNGHRQRLKNKVRDFGLKVLAEHEILELLLTYTIPRKDTNELAHTLLNKYKTLSGVIDADKNSLKTVLGVGEETTLFFTLLKDFFEIYKDKKCVEKLCKINTIRDAVKYFKQHFLVGDKEFTHFVCLNSKGYIIHSFGYNGENDCNVDFDINKFVAEINNKNIASVIMFHTHPGGEVNPSEADLNSTERIKSICNCLGVSLYDHLIFNESSYFSMRTEQIL